MPAIPLTAKDKENANMHLLLNSANVFYDLLSEKFGEIEPLVRPNDPIETITMQLEKHAYLDLRLLNAKDQNSPVHFKFSKALGPSFHPSTSHSILANPLHHMAQPFGAYAMIEIPPVESPRYRGPRNEYLCIYGAFNQDTRNTARNLVSFTFDMAELYDRSRTEILMPSGRFGKVARLVM